MKSKLMVVAGVIAILASSTMYLIDYLIFGDSHQLLIQLVDDLSFIPISVFIVVVVIERLLACQEIPVCVKISILPPGSVSHYVS